MLQRAKDELLARITSDEAIKDEAARLAADDLAHSLHQGEVILAASEQMKVHTPPQCRPSDARGGCILDGHQDHIRHHQT
jgi:hypothetical protein